jgi:predicted DNA-binding ribbon-helix-helix protein
VLSIVKLLEILIIERRKIVSSRSVLKISGQRKSLAVGKTFFLAFQPFSEVKDKQVSQCVVIIPIHHNANSTSISKFKVSCGNSLKFRRESFATTMGRVETSVIEGAPVTYGNFETNLSEFFFVDSSSVVQLAIVCRGAQPSISPEEDLRSSWSRVFTVAT